MRKFVFVFLIVFSTHAEAALRTWDGGGANALWSTAQNWVGDVAPVPGDTLVFPAGAAQPTNTNDFAAGAGFQALTIEGAGYRLEGNQTFLPNGITATYASGTSTIALPIQILLTLPVNVVNAGAVLTIDGVISGLTSELTKNGAGTLRLTASNTYTGTTRVTAGVLEAAPPGATTTSFGNGAHMTVEGGRLTGRAIGMLSLTALGGTVAPTPQFGTTHLTLFTLSTYEVDLSSTGNDLITVQNNVILGQPTLMVIGAPPGGIGTQYLIIDNQSANPTNGTFAGLPEGATITAAGRTYRISYIGGTDNDVVLTIVAGALAPGNIPTLTETMLLALAILLAALGARMLR